MTALPPRGVLEQLGLAEDPSINAVVTRALDDGLTQVELYLPDMRCGGCASRIEAALHELGGVRRVRSNPARHLIAIDYEPTDVGLAQLLGTIEGVGYTPLFTVSTNDDAGTRATNRAQLKRLGVAGIAMMQVMTVSISLYTVDHAPMEPFYLRLFQWIALLFTTPVVFYSAQPFFAGAARSLRACMAMPVRGAALGLSMDVPVAVAIAAAYAASCLSTVTGSGPVYFDSVSMFVFLLLTARYLEQNARRRLAGFDDWLQLFPERVTRVTDGIHNSIDVEEIRAGDELWVTGGSRVPADGTIVAGHSDFDEALLTGESAPVTRACGERVYAGTVNLRQGVLLRADVPPERTRIAMLKHLADRASLDRPRALHIADRVAAHFILAVLVLAALTFAGWSFYDPARAFAAMIAVLVVSCPCALSLAAPAAVTAAATALRRSGFVVTRGDVLDRLADTTDVIFDKTGTLTGPAELVDVVPHADLDHATCLELASALERGANHPLANAFVGDRPAGRVMTDIEVYPGRGVAGRWAGAVYRLGSAEFCTSAPEAARSGVHTMVYLARGDLLVASFGVRSALRADARSTVLALQRLGLHVRVLSGDAWAPTAAASRALSGVEFQSGVTPEQKLAFVNTLQGTGRRAVMVGDGINDVPVLAAAAVSVTPLDATDLAKHAADAILLSRGLAPLVYAVTISRRTRRVIRQNLSWAVAYNLVAIPLAVFGLLAPWVAALGMSSSSLLVTLNALRLRRSPAEARPVIPATTPLS